MIPGYGGRNILGTAIRPPDNVFPEVYRDIKPQTQIGSSLTKTTGKPYDHMLFQGNQLLELRAADKKHIMRSLWLVWSTYDQESPENLGETEIWTQEVLDHFEEISSLNHLEFSPFLFLRNWRQLAKNTKDKLNSILANENSEKDHNALPFYSMKGPETLSKSSF